MTRPTAAFEKVPLTLRKLPAGEHFFRLYPGRYPDPLGFGTTPSRFSDPRAAHHEPRFGVLYLGTSLEVCFLEAVLRDNRNGAVGDYPIEERELDAMCVARIMVRQDLTVADLTGNNCIIMGIPSDVTGATRQTLARHWSAALHAHPQRPDGIFYTSRLNKSLACVAIYDRAIEKLACTSLVKLTDAAELPGILDKLQVSLV